MFFLIPFFGFFSKIKATKIIKKVRFDIPIIFQTAYIVGDEFDKIKRSGCDDFIIKPIDAVVLLQKIGKLLK